MDFVRTAALAVFLYFLKNQENKFYRCRLMSSIATIQTFTLNSRYRGEANNPNLTKSNRASRFMTLLDYE
jgi:hypothetical protein